MLNAYTIAGGAPGGDPSKATVLRTVDGKQTLIKVNIDAIQKKGDFSQNIALEPGDILAVPPRGRAAFGISDILSPIGLLKILFP